MENYKIKAAKLFESGYNCAQAVAVAFCDITKQDEKEVARMASPFGGGMGRMREVCGSVSGMLMVLGALYGYDGKDDDNSKKQLYTDVQTLMKKFEQEAGSYICREILKNPSNTPTPTVRTEEFYATRPCTRMVMLAAGLLEEFIKNH